MTKQHLILKENRPFLKIDAEWKAYFLGLFGADGSLSDQGTGYITLAETDKYILDILRKKIYKTPQKLIKKQGRNKNVQNSYLLYLSKELCQDFHKYNMIVNKSLTLEFPRNIPKKYLPDFIRGFFDGDGSINKGQSHIELSICCSKPFGISLQQILKDNQINISLYKHGSIFRLRSGNSKELLKFFNLIYYQNTVLKLTRKYKLFQKALNNTNWEKINRPKSSKYIGVIFYPRGKSHWIARIKINRKSIELGCYKTELEAAKARIQGEIKYFGKPKQKLLP